MAIMAMTTSSSMSVNPAPRRGAPDRAREAERVPYFITYLDVLSYAPSRKGGRMQRSKVMGPDRARSSPYSYWANAIYFAGRLNDFKSMKNSRNIYANSQSMTLG